MASAGRALASTSTVLGGALLRSASKILSACADQLARIPRGDLMLLFILCDGTHSNHTHMKQGLTSTRRKRRDDSGYWASGLVSPDPTKVLLMPDDDGDDDHDAWVIQDIEPEHRRVAMEEPVWWLLVVQ
jgi:hypothetical protein